MFYASMIDLSTLYPTHEYREIMKDYTHEFPQADYPLPNTLLLTGIMLLPFACMLVCLVVISLL
jgi:hypothetical protein